RARCAGLGIPAAGSFPCQESLHQHFTMGRYLGRARTISETVAAPGSRAFALSACDEQFHLRHSTSGASPNSFDDNAERHHANELPESLLEHRATTRASYGQWLQPSAWRSARERND